MGYAEHRPSKNEIKGGVCSSADVPAPPILSQGTSAMGNLRVIRKPRERNFTQIDNEPINDKANVSPEVLGMLVYILSKPDGWKLWPKDLVRKDCEIDRVYRILASMREAGYAERKDVRDKGRFVGYDYVVSETRNTEDNSQTEPFREIPETVLPETETSETEKARHSKTDISKTNSSNTPVANAPGRPKTREQKLIDTYAEKRKMNRDAIYDGRAIKLAETILRKMEARNVKDIPAWVDAFIALPEQFQTRSKDLQTFARDDVADLVWTQYKETRKHKIPHEEWLDHYVKSHRERGLDAEGIEKAAREQFNEAVAQEVGQRARELVTS